MGAQGAGVVAVQGLGGDILNGRHRVVIVAAGGETESTSHQEKGQAECDRVIRFFRVQWFLFG